MAGETLSEIDRLNDALTGQPFKLALIDIDEVELLEKNARYMPAEMFRNLVDNIKRDGGLTSVPFCYKHNGKYRVLSGNHRVMAAREAGIRDILVMYTDRPLSKQEQVAIQLSHNAIEGKDDPVILKELWDEIKEIDLKIYAGLDDKLLKELEAITIEPLSEVKLDYRTLSFVFLPEEIDRLDEVFEEAIKGIPDQDIRLARLQEFNRLLEALSKTEGSYSIKNNATALMIILDVFERHLTDLAEGWEEREPKKGEKVPIASVLGSDDIPTPVAQRLKSVVQKMLDRGEISKGNLWKALEILLDGYGGDNE